MVEALLFRLTSITNRKVSETKHFATKTKVAAADNPLTAAAMKNNITLSCLSSSFQPKPPCG